MPKVTTKIGTDVYLDKMVRGLGLCVKHRLYINLPKSKNDDKIFIIEGEEEEEFEYNDRAVLEGSDHNNEVNLYYADSRLDLPEGKPSEVKKSIASYLKQKKYNKIVKKCKETTPSVNITIGRNWGDSLVVAKSDLPFILKLLDAFCA
jgi:hypothetical protein